MPKTPTFFAGLYENFLTLFSFFSPSPSTPELQGHSAALSLGDLDPNGQIAVVQRKWPALAVQRGAKRPIQPSSQPLTIR